MIYKISTKLLVERLKFLLPIIISKEQGAFVYGFFLDGLVIASKVIQSMCTSRECAMFIKLDIAKAYDKVNWGFLQKFLLTFGFS